MMVSELTLEETRVSQENESYWAWVSFERFRASSKVRRTQTRSLTFLFKGKYRDNLIYNGEFDPGSG